MGRLRDGVFVGTLGDQSRNKGGCRSWEEWQRGGREIRIGARREEEVEEIRRKACEKND